VDSERGFFLLALWFQACASLKGLLSFCFRGGTEKKEGGGLGAENWGRLVSAPGCLAVGDLLRDFPHPALRQVWLVVLALAFHRDSLLKRHRLPIR
jgi:hypothetical protein